MTIISTPDIARSRRQDNSLRCDALGLILLRRAELDLLLSLNSASVTDQTSPDQTILPSCQTMGLLGLLCDCFNRRSVVKSHSNPSYARLVEAKEPPAYSSLPIDVATVSSHRSSWKADGVDEDARLLPPHITVVDEKEPLEAIVDSAASSPQSSTVSLPSTRVTALTVTTDYTGASRASRMSHESGITFGAPPSYSSRRSVTLPRSNRSSWDRHHPVHAEDWFDQFRDP